MPQSYTPQAKMNPRFRHVNHTSPPKKITPPKKTTKQKIKNKAVLKQLDLVGGFNPFQKY